MHYLKSFHLGFGIFLLTLLTGCSSDTVLPKTENDILNHLLQSAPATIIELNGMLVDTFYVNDKDILGQQTSTSLSSPVRLGRIAGFVKLGDSLYVADQQQGCIWVMDVEQGIWHRQIGSPGRGPREFGGLNGITKNANHIFVTDVTNSRIHVYNHHFNLITAFDRVISGGVSWSGKGIDVTDSFLYTPLDFHVEDKLIEIRQTTSPFAPVGSILPRLIPPGMQPGAYNNYTIDANELGKVAISYVGLPYIFIFNFEHELQNIIYLRFSEDETIDNPSTEPVDIPAKNEAEALGVKGLIGNLRLANNGSLFFFSGGKFYHITYDSEANEYQLDKIRFFTFGDSENRKSKPQGIVATNVIIEDDTIYLGSIFEEYIYRFLLD